jgi:hypothetical protein
MFKVKKKKHLKELNRIRCQRYYQRHKQEIKESRKYGSIHAYRKQKEETAKTIIKAIELENKKQEIPLL